MAEMQFAGTNPSPGVPPTVVQNANPPVTPEAPVPAAPAAVTPAVPVTPSAPAPAAVKPPGAAAPTDGTLLTPSLKNEVPTQPPVAPEKYDLKLPENSLLDPAYIEKLSGEAKAKGLSNEQAQAILDRDSGLKASFIDEQKSFLKTKADQWFQEAKADKEIGGDSFKENVEYAKRALGQFASENLRKILNETGLGNNPELIRTFMKVGKMMAPDKLVVPGVQAPSLASAADRLYPTSKT